LRAGRWSAVTRRVRAGGHLRRLPRGPPPPPHPFRYSPGSPHPRSSVTVPAVRGTATSAAPTHHTDPAAKPGFRPDVQGLRAIAVLLVVLFHAGVETLSGGYVGVDVFFVISGFLITTHLLESLEREGRIRFGRFYARRARRILPAALLVAALTLLASWIWLSPLLMRSVVGGAIATALYGPNYFFALQDTDYLAESTPSVY